jgi:CPA2 family monovalent cation:H+ antiporter-2
MQLENVDIGLNSRLIGVTIKAARSETGITALAMRKKNGTLLSNPADEETIDDGDQLIVIGTKQQLATLEEALEGSKSGRSK